MLKKNTVLYNFFVLLLVSAVISVTGCKKDDDNPAGSNSSITGSGKVTLNGGSFSNKTYNFQSALGVYATVSHFTSVTCYAPTTDSLYLSVAFPSNTTGTYNWTLGTNSYSIVILYINGAEYYSYANGQTNVTKYEGAGGKIEGTFSGYLHSMTATDSINVSGSFSGTRVTDVATKK